MTRTKPVWLAAILVVCLAIGAIGNLWQPAGLIIFIVTLVLYAIARAAAAPLNALPHRAVWWGLVLGGSLMLLAQLAILVWMPVTVYHDPFRVLAQAEVLASGRFTWTSTYFWRYANNVPLTYLLSLWLRFGQLLGWSGNVAIHALSLLLLDGLIGLMLVTVWQLSHRLSLVVGTFAFFACTPFAYTYNLQVFYSDLPSLLVLLIIMRLFWRWPSQGHWQHGLAGSGLVLTVLLGALIKPNLIVLLPALAIIAVILARRQLLKPLKLGLPIALVVLGFALSSPVSRGIQHVTHYTPHAAYTLPVSNWPLMGLNATTNGTYAPADVHNATRLPSVAARNHAAVAQIGQRLRHLGPVGLLRLWLVKLGILLHVGNIQVWYNGGFRQAPGWYLRHATAWRLLTIISYTAASLTLWLFLAGRLLRWQPDWRQPTAVVAMLAVVTTLGYLAFHTLLWETEGRYSQIILPLLFVTLTAIPVPATVPRTVPVRRHLPTVIALGFVAVIGLGETIQPAHLADVVAAQRSQLSAQYQAKPTQLAPHSTMTQAVTLNGPANEFSVQIHAHDHVQVALENLATHTAHRLTATGAVYRLHHRLLPGQYRIRVTNPGFKPQPINVVATPNYRLSAAPLVIAGHAHATASLVYTSLLRHSPLK